MNLKTLIGQTNESSEQTATFALLALGVVESLASGVLSTADAVRVFFNADNGLFVRRQLRDKTADRIMGHGTQLADLYEELSPEEAQREFQRELATMRQLCLKLLGRKRLVA